MGKLIRTIKNVLGGETNKNYDERSGWGKLVRIIKNVFWVGKLMRTIKNVLGGETNKNY